jgi:hypothetical protein
VTWRRAVLATGVLLLGAVGCGDGRGPSSPEPDQAGRADRHEAAAPAVATADDRGSFSVPCTYSHSAGDDPIVHHDHASVSHEHDFFGATTTDSHSTSDSLLAGETTCRSVADRSAYWAPQLLDAGRPVAPTEVVAYYRTPVGVDARNVEPLPNGLEMIAGDADSTAEQDPRVSSWSCGPAGPKQPQPFQCPQRGAGLQLNLVFPVCWDGTNLGSADHRSHLATVVRADDGTAACPDSHPVVLPEVTVEVRYPPMAAPGPFTLASGPVTGGHGDILVAWDQDHLASEVETCLRANRRCDVP